MKNQKEPIQLEQGDACIRTAEGRVTAITGVGLDSDETRVCLYTADGGTWIELSSEAVGAIVQMCIDLESL